MNLATDCSKCVFADKTTSQQSCQFGIPDSIRSSRNIDIKNEYNYINKYTCKYGFAKSKLQELKENFPDINIIEYIKIQNLIKYYLVINNLDNNVNATDLCNRIKRLEIQPQAISILTRQNNLTAYIKECEEAFGQTEKLVWRVHNFLNKQLSVSASVHSVMSTNNYYKNSNHLWILHDTQIQYMIDNKIINSINYIINIMQPEIGIMKSQITDDLVGGIFLDKQTYNRLTANISPELDTSLKAIIDIDNVKIIEYDEN